MPSRLWTELDFAKDGKQVGTIHLPHSVTRSAYGLIEIPLAVIRNGPGPTLFLMGGCHGDEWEGQIALGRLVRELEPATIRGRVIVLPSASLPAAKAGVRVSPIDNLNLNRTFPGRADGLPTQQIAHYIDTVLMPMADVFVDLHSGGVSLQYLPSTWVSLIDEPDHDSRSLAALRAFGGRLGIALSGAEAKNFPGTSSDSATAKRVIALSGEYGGAGDVSLDGLRVIETGLRNLMAHLGMTAGAPTNEAPMRITSIDRKELYLFSPEYGVFEPARMLGEEVRQGEPAGRIHSIEFPWRAPIEVHFRASGLLVARRAIGSVKPGDCLLHLAADLAA